MRRLFVLFFVFASLTAAAAPTFPCSGGKEADLPLPSTLTKEKDPAAYQRLLFDFLTEKKYRDLGWCVDKGLRDTGPYINGRYYGTHPVVRIWYSPAAVRWLQNGREGAIDDRAMIIKEQFSNTPAAQFEGMTEKEIDDWFFSGNGDWTVMVRDAKGSADGWYWAEIWQKDYPFDTYDAPFPVFNSGFGLYCLRCHGSAEKELTFTAAANIEGLPGDPLTFRDDNSWRPAWPPATPSPHLPAATQARTTPQHDADDPGEANHPRTDKANMALHSAEPSPPTKALLDFLLAHPTKPGFKPRALPGENYDHIVSPHGKPQLFVTSDQCMGCHAGNTYGNVMLVTKDGKVTADLSPYGEWRWSPMGLAGRDPIFYTQLDSEIAFLNTLGDPKKTAQVVDLCFSCHGAMGQRQLKLETGGKQLFQREWVYETDKKNPHFESGALARDGVSCAVCHHIKRDDSPLPDFLRTTLTGEFLYTKAEELGGPFEDPAKPPMVNGLGITPVHDTYMKDARICGTCHAINLPVLDAKSDAHVDERSGKGPDPYDNCPLGNGHCSFEQGTYLEWLNSDFQNEIGKPGPLAQTCQECHMKGTFEDKVVQTKIAAVEDNQYPAAEHRAPNAELNVPVRTSGYARHQFQGLNTFLLGFFSQFSNLLGVRTCSYMASGCSEKTWFSNIPTAMANFTEQARKETATIAVSAPTFANGVLTSDVTVTNLTGHRLPSGVSFRRAFIEFTATDANGNLLFASGRTNAAGVIVDINGKPLPSEYVGSRGPNGMAYQPHYWSPGSPITRSDQVQIFEELLKDANGKFTTSFLRQDVHFKDNRILPRGWTHAGPDPKLFFGRPLEETHPDGVGADAHYADPLGAKGQSVVRYQFPLPSGVDPATVNVSAKLYYQSVPPYYLNQRFEQAGDQPATQRLFYIVTNFDTTQTYGLPKPPMENWKVLIAENHAGTAAPPQHSFVMTSPAFREGETMPESTVLNGLACNGPNLSPALEWRNAPAGTKSFALICDDYEARDHDGFIHWAVYNIPAPAAGLPENAGAAEGDLAGGGRHAYNDFLKRNYGGPCPPEGPPHKYRFTVYALDLPEIDDAGTPMTWRKLRVIIKGHVLGEASLTGLKGR